MTEGIPRGGRLCITTIKLTIFALRPRCLTTDTGSRWSEGQMPWDATELFVADLGTNGLGTATLVLDGTEESVVEPSWSPDGVLHFISDRTGWWNLYRWDGGSVMPVAPMAAECAAAPWELGYSSYAFCRTAGWLCFARRTRRWTGSS